MRNKKQEAIEKRIIENGGAYEDYICPYCNCIFDKLISTSSPGTPQNPKQIISSQVQCPACKNFIKTFKK